MPDETPAQEPTYTVTAAHSDFTRAGGDLISVPLASRALVEPPKEPDPREDAALQRIRMLAQGQARDNHYNDEDRLLEPPLNNIAPECFHVGKFETCHHTDCVSVRASSPSLSAEPPKEPEAALVPRAPLDQLIKRWLAESAQIATYHATMGTGYKDCADQLAAALRAAVPPPAPEKLLKRYLPVTEGAGYCTRATMIENALGQWVRYTDVAPAPDPEAP